MSRFHSMPLLALTVLAIAGCAAEGERSSYSTSATTWNFSFPGASRLKAVTGEILLSEGMDYVWTAGLCDSRWGEYTGLFSDLTGRPGIVRVVAVGYRNGERVEAVNEIVLGSSFSGGEVVFTFSESITECRLERAFKDRN